jgi:hypothetical protein
MGKNNEQRSFRFEIIDRIEWKSRLKDRLFWFILIKNFKVC